MLHAEESDFKESPRSCWSQTLDYSDTGSYHIMSLALFYNLPTDPSQKAFLPRAITCLSDQGSSLKDYFLNQHLENVLYDPATYTVDRKPIQGSRT